MTYHYPDLGSASDWSYDKGNLFQPIKALPRSEKWHVISTDFCTCSPDIISQGNRWCRHKMLAVFSGWVWMSTLSHLVLPSDYKNYMMFSNSPSGVSVNNGHGATLWECYQIYSRNNATLTAFTWTFLYYHQKKKTALYTAGCKINTITCQMQVTNHLKAWQDTCLMTKAVKCTLICLQKKRKKLYSRLELFTDLQHLQ